MAAPPRPLRAGGAACPGPPGPAPPAAPPPGCGRAGGAARAPGAGGTAAPAAPTPGRGGRGHGTSTTRQGAPPGLLKGPSLRAAGWGRASAWGPGQGQPRRQRLRSSSPALPLAAAQAQRGFRRSPAQLRGRALHGAAAMSGAGASGAAPEPPATSGVAFASAGGFISLGGLKVEGRWQLCWEAVRGKQAARLMSWSQEVRTQMACVQRNFWLCQVGGISPKSLCASFPAQFLPPGVTCGAGRTQEGAALTPGCAPAQRRYMCELGHHCTANTGQGSCVCSRFCNSGLNQMKSLVHLPPPAVPSWTIGPRLQHRNLNKQPRQQRFSVKNTTRKTRHRPDFINSGG
ncbi:uncharacterized protein [Patagioenas fasciata]|uniref:uncharacterized protein n=1 Tax=Patagioenas fasciata TaxID=372321 RepID=UPI003A98EBAB